MNWNISEEDSTVKYASIQDAIQVIQKLGRGCYMAKSDIKSAFRLIPVSKNDYPRLGFKFNGAYYYDKCLTQGGSSSCKIFEEFSSALEWILKNKFHVKHLCHVLDDFLFLGVTYEECAKYLAAWKKLCQMLGVPLAEDKTIGPDQTMVFLGVELSSLLMIARLPKEKLERYNTALSEMVKARTTKLKNMQSLIGCLQFAINVILPGKSFVRRLIDTTIGIEKPFHYVTISFEAKADIRM